MLRQRIATREVEHHRARRAHQHRRMRHARSIGRLAKDVGKAVRRHESERVIIAAKGVVRVHRGHFLPQA
jgi:hypothetical protein